MALLRSAPILIRPCASALLVVAFVCAQPVVAREFQAAEPLFRQFCFDCHGNAAAEANVNLERLTAEPSFDTTFKTWRNVAEMLETKKMPPKDAPQPMSEQRRQLVGLVR